MILWHFVVWGKEGRVEENLEFLGEASSLVERRFYGVVLNNSRINQCLINELMNPEHPNKIFQKEERLCMYPT